MLTATVTVELPIQLYADLQALAEKEHADLAALLERLIKAPQNQPAQQPTASPTLQAILARATDLGVSDLSSQHDHYLYNVEKQ